MRTRSLRTTTAMALILASGLGLAACSTDEEPSPGSASAASTDEAEAPGSEISESAMVYEFDDVRERAISGPSFMTSETTPLVVTLPDTVRELTAEGDKPVVDSYTLVPRMFAPQLCALDISVSYVADGPGAEGLKAGHLAEWPSNAHITPEMDAAQRLFVSGDEMEFVDALPADEDLVAAVQQFTDDFVLYYVLNDFSAGTVARPCAQSMDDLFVRLAFTDDGLRYQDDDAIAHPDMHETENLFSSTGSASFSLYSDGLLSVISSSISGAESNVLGEWIATTE